MNKQLAKLRSILHDAPSARTWEKICWVLTRCADERRGFELALEYVESHLDANSHWPDALRQASREWWTCIWEGGNEPRWRLVRALDASRLKLTTQDAIRMSRVRELSQLTHLNLSHNPIGDAGVSALLASPYLSNLVALDLSCCRLGNPGLAELAASPNVSKLVELRLSGNIIRAAGISALVSSPHLKQLKHLDLSSNTLSLEGGRALASEDGPGRLSHLNVSECGFGTLDFLVNAPWLSELELLRLSNNHLHSPALEGLCSAPCLPKLNLLDLSHNPMGDGGLIGLAAMHELGLERLDLASSHITSVGAAALANSKAFACLKVLTLSKNPIEDRGLSVLAKAQSFSSLAVMHLSDASIGSPGVVALAKADALPSLTELDLSWNLIDDAGLEALAKSFILKRLTHLNLDFNPHINDQGIVAMARSNFLSEELKDEWRRWANGLVSMRRLRPEDLDPS